MHILSEIVKADLTATDKTNGFAVGEGLAPPETTEIEYTLLGEIAEKQLFLLVGEGLAPPLPWMM